jgi:hypothetical protein
MNAEQHWTAAKQDEIDELEKINGYLVDYIQALLIVDLNKVTQEGLDNEITGIVAGEHSAMCRMVIDQWEAHNERAK